MIILYKIIGFLINLISLISPKLGGHIALTFFSRPQKGRIKEKDYDFLNTAFKEELNHEKYSVMTYRWVGNNKTILLAHGWESNSARWMNLIKQLRAHDYNIIALDAPAHGRSGSKSFNAILYSEFIHIVANKFDPDVIIGHSVGGMASVFYQHKYQNPELEKLVLLGAPSNFRDVFKRYIKLMSYNRIVDKAMSRIVEKKYGHLPDYFSAADFAKEIEAKGLIIHDEKDRVIPYTDAKHLEEGFRNAQLVTTQGYGHSLNNDTVTKHIKAFIAD